MLLSLYHISMKLADQLLLDSILREVTPLYESATADRMSRAIAKYQREQGKNLTKNLDNTLKIILDVMKDVRKNAKGLDNKLERKFDDAITKLGMTLSALNIKPLGRPFDVKR
jgi:hypothetical protein